MVVPTKSTRERIWSARGLEAKVTELLALLGDSAGQHLGAKTRDPMLTVLEEGTATLRLHATGLLNAELDHLKELSDDGEPRDVREVLAGEVRSILIGLRGTVTSWWPEKEAAARSLARVPQTNDELLAMARAVLASWKPLPPSEAGGSFDFTAALENLRVKTEAFAEALGLVSREAAEAETALRRRREATGAFDCTFELLAGIATDLLVAAGEQEAADRLRPSRSRRGRTTAVADGLEAVPEDVDVPAPAAEPSVPAPADAEGVA